MGTGVMALESDLNRTAHERYSRAPRQSNLRETRGLGATERGDDLGSLLCGTRRPQCHSTEWEVVRD